VSTPSVLFVCVENDGKSQPVDYALARDVDPAVTLGRGVDGLERTRLIRDDIAARVQRLYSTLTDATP
jgi:arsenate-mycothiol transferase